MADAAAPARARRAARALAAAGLLAAAGCAEVEGRPPLARIDLVPAAIPENDNFQTAVTLDGSRSADPVDDPGTTTRLSYRWTIEGDEARFAAGSDASDVAPVVTFRGQRPATIVLTVTDRDGLDASATAYLQLTVRPR